MQSERRRDSRVLELLSLADPKCQAVEVAGGKAASLARLFRSMPEAIPAGWVLPTSATRELIADTSRSKPTESEGELQAALVRDLPEPTHSYAVRSSATDEDSASHSFAGQYETILAVRTPARIANAVLTCVRSGSSSRILAYRRASGTDHADPAAPAVLIQEMVAAERSGVAFTVHPVTGAHQTVLNATYGLGDLLVGGEVTPDTFVVDDSGQLVESTLGTKRRMTILSPAGLDDVSVPETLRQRLCLSPADVHTVVAAAKRCETQLGFAVDVEWAISKDRVFVLQARPVTGLDPQAGDR